MNELERIEADLVRALTTIRTYWPALLATTSGSGGGSASSDEVTSLDRRISLRHEVTLILNGWARIVVEDRNLSHGLPLGTDTLGMVTLLERHARWFCGHEAAPDALAELATVAEEVRRTAAPSRREWIYLGDCPFVIEDWFCSGQVRAWPEGDRLPACSVCGQEAVVEWWEEVLGVNRYLVKEQLATFIREETGRTVSRFTVARWLHSGRIESCGTDEQGRTIYDRGAVAYALSRQISA